LPQDYRSLPQQALRVYFKDKTTGLPLRAQLEIYEAKGNPATRLSQWSLEDGHITTAIQRKYFYELLLLHKDYLMYSANLEPDSSASRYIEIDMLPMEKVEHESVVLENVFFETGSAQLLPASEPELQKLLYTLKTNQSMIIEIRGYTDNVGDEAMKSTVEPGPCKGCLFLADRKRNAGLPASLTKVLEKQSCGQQ
jgi:outer membrane protein OmpA-like peptidoglycan-associated protein